MPRFDAFAHFDFATVDCFYCYLLDSFLKKFNLKSLAVVVVSFCRVVIIHYD
jgi:hypothetical protein